MNPAAWPWLAGIGGGAILLGFVAWMTAQGVRDKIADRIADAERRWYGTALELGIYDTGRVFVREIPLPSAPAPSWYGRYRPHKSLLHIDPPTEPHGLPAASESPTEGEST